MEATRKILATEPLSEASLLLLQGGKDFKVSKALALPPKPPEALSAACIETKSRSTLDSTPTYIITLLHTSSYCKISDGKTNPGNMGFFYALPSPASPDGPI